jgi:hypothetical protein
LFGFLILSVVLDCCLDTFIFGDLFVAGFGMLMIFDAYLTFLRRNGHLAEP